MTVNEKRLAGIIRELRQKIFYHEKFRVAREREDKDRQASREASNIKAHFEWDAETERMISGSE